MKRLLLPLLFSLLVSVSVSAKYKPIEPGYYANRAFEELSNGNYEKACEAAVQSVQAEKENPWSFYAYALCADMAEQSGDAISNIDKAIPLAKKDKPLQASLYSYKSDMLLQIGDTLQAIKAIEKAVKTDSKNAEYLVENARLIKSADLKKTVKLIEKAKKLNPQYGEAYREMAWIYSNQGQNEQALAEITRAISIDPKNADFYFCRGVLRQESKTAGWIDDLFTSYSLEKNYLIPIYLMTAEDPRDRREILSIIDKTKSREQEMYPLGALCSYTWEDYPDAIERYNEIIDLGLDYSGTFKYLAKSYSELGEIIKAYSTAMRGLDKYPDDPDLLLVTISTGIDCGRSDKVLPLIDKVIAQKPESAEAYVSKGEALMNLKRYREALEPLTDALTLNETPYAMLLSADALRLIGDKTKAGKIYQDIADLYSMESEDALEDIHLAMLAMAYAGLGDRNKALSMVRRYDLENGIDSPEDITEAYCRLGMPQQALAEMEKYSRTHPEWNPADYIYSYRFYPLQELPEFEKLLARHGLKTRRNADTGLLEYVPEEVSYSSGGTPLQEALNMTGNGGGNWIQQLNAACPIDIGMLGQIEAVSADDASRTIIINIVTNPDMLDYQILEANPELKRKKIDMQAMSFASTISDVFLNSGVSFKYNYREKDGPGKFSYTISNKEMRRLKRAALSPDEMDKMVIDLMYEEDKMASEKEGHKVSYDGKTYSLTYPVSEEEFNKFEFAVNMYPDQFDEGMSPFFNDPSFKDKAKRLVKQNITFKIIYEDAKTGRTVEIAYPPEKLAKMLK